MPAPILLSPSDFALLCRVIRAVARASRLPASEAEDFSQWVHLSLLQRNYAPLTRYTGRSSLQTYVTVLVRRLLLDWRNMRFGKWRPSAWARRNGPIAVNLDRLVSRDHYSVDEAVNLLSGRPGYPPPDALRALAVQVPARCRPRPVPCDDLAPLVATDFADPVEAKQDVLAKRRLLRSLRGACEQLAPLDRHLLHLRFEKNLPVVAIAERLGVTAKPLYRRIDKVVASLRRALAVTHAGQRIRSAPIRAEVPHRRTNAA